MELVRKKWIVVVYVALGNLPIDHVPDYMSKIKESIPEKTFEDFFETEVLVFYVPERKLDEESRFEFHEIILDAVGYDKYETIIHNKNMKTSEVLNQLKEMLNVKE